jgi:hypothetical protein
MERFKFGLLNKFQITEQYQFNICNTFVALEHLEDNRDTNRA